ncbi:MerR family transcriptional regulator [Streptomyces fodineus]|uniref:MerR family transcriptional regulator n=1 Tax=Streptomyces fodineus TaxID=1904616 RepID=A0A1D7YDZ1_9ACTN|nr:MerR family transcriptional regulator [Streptomyces fodineus]AOR33771.1 MerR family transcriptional regulator [Streptomyces fodineus]
MHSGASYSIGELARRTGMSVKTIRFYSDQGLVMPESRTPAGYRRYGPEAVARLTLVRTLRELGLGLEVIRRIVDRPVALGRIAAEQAAALDVQISVLRLRRAVLSAVAARREPTFEEMELMHRLATLSAAERKRLIDGFLDAVFDAPQPSEAGFRRSLTPELPDRPTEEQVAAWVELAELSLDDGFRAAVRRLVREHAGDRAGPAGDVGAPPVPEVVAVARDVVNIALVSGTRPEAPEADPVVATLVARCAHASGHRGPDSPHAWLLRRLEAAREPRRDTYLRLLARINGWPAPEPLTPVIDWAVTALRIRAVA